MGVFILCFVKTFVDRFVKHMVSFSGQYWTPRTEGHFFRDVMFCLGRVGYFHRCLIEDFGREVRDDPLRAHVEGYGHEFGDEYARINKPPPSPLLLILTPT